MTPDQMWESPDPRDPWGERFASVIAALVLLGSMGALALLGIAPCSNAEIRLAVITAFGTLIGLSGSFLYRRVPPRT